jgi:hypothetical protein
MQAVAIAATVVSAYGSIQEGKAKRDYYNLQAAQTRVESDRRAIQYQFQANQILQRINATNASVIARGYAGGVGGFDGSSALVQAVNNTRGGKEFAFALGNADAVRRGGLIQATLYESAGKTAERAGYFDAAGKLGMAAMSSSKIGSAPTTSAPVTDASRTYIGQSGDMGGSFGINPDARLGGLR